MRHRFLVLLLISVASGSWLGCIFNPQPEPPADEETTILPGGGTGGSGATAGMGGTGASGGWGGVGGAGGGVGQGGTNAGGDSGLFDSSLVGGMRVDESGGAGGEAGGGGELGGYGGSA